MGAGNEREFIDHLQNKEGKEQAMQMKAYRLYHRVLKEFRDVKAESAQEACNQVDWLIGDTWVRELTPVVVDPSTESGHRGGGWKNVTPREGY